MMRMKRVKAVDVMCCGLRYVECMCAFAWAWFALALAHLFQNSHTCNYYYLRGLTTQYVDLDYQGGGIGEYQFWDADSKKWDTSACDYTAKTSGSSSGRCAKMDCHLEDTHWSLLGFFKHAGYDDWMEQLFKHEGICVWSDEEYSFMKNARKTWPQGCTVSSTVTSSGDPIYYDIKPIHGGGITLGLYTDTRCVKEYQSSGKNDPINVENVIGNLLVNGGSNDHSGDKNNNNNAASSTYTTLAASLQAWDDAFSIWKQCQPCVAYDRHNYGYGTSDSSYRGSSYGKYRYGYDDDYAWSNYYSSKYSGSDFDCYDDADYTNVNQVRVRSFCVFQCMPSYTECRN
jgi:hypothetical protein